MAENEAGGVSRRDFLRSASKKAAKEVVETGTKLVPGGAIVRQFLEAEAIPANTETEDEPETEEVTRKDAVKQGPISWLLALRAKKSPPGPK